MGCPSTSAFEEIVDIVAKLLSRDGAKDCKQYNEVAGVAWRAYDASAGSRSAVFVPDEAANCVNRLAERVLPNGPLHPFKLNRIRISHYQSLCRRADRLSMENRSLGQRPRGFSLCISLCWLDLILLRN
jgi:hypothetical protein